MILFIYLKCSHWAGGWWTLQAEVFLWLWLPPYKDLRRIDLMPHSKELICLWMHLDLHRDSPGEPIYPTGAIYF
jgi:hypothetical protein